jgi:diamine N-acetyltransferase
MLPTMRTNIAGLPLRFADKSGHPLELQLLDDTLRQPLLNMYLAFQPRNCFQGLPPIRDEVCTRWVQDMIRDAVNFVVCGAGVPAVAGHAALFPIDDSRCEMLVVVSPKFQNHGAGTQLVRASVRAAGDLGFERVWIPVAATNVRARHVYEKCGFEYLSRGLARELEMVCPVGASPNAIGEYARPAFSLNNGPTTPSTDCPQPICPKNPSLGPKDKGPRPVQPCRI